MKNEDKLYDVWWPNKVDISYKDSCYLSIAGKMKAAYEQVYIFRFVLVEKK